MPNDTKKWKKLSTEQGRGGRVYLSKTDLRRLERQGAVDLDKDLEYSVNTGVSDGRARAFIEIREAEGQD